jgi:hypothetical protein
MLPRRSCLSLAVWLAAEGQRHRTAVADRRLWIA